MPDDQFVNFWFALEIVAEFQKSTDKVPDKCPKCQSPLYCKSCKTHPVHRPYARQAIRALLKAADKECDEATIERLVKTRNSLMHGSTLKEIEDSLPQPHEQIVDVLGRLLWKALILQFPHEMFDGSWRWVIHRPIYIARFAGSPTCKQSFLWAPMATWTLSSRARR